MDRKTRSSVKKKQTQCKRRNAMEEWICSPELKRLTAIGYAIHGPFLVLWAPARTEPRPRGRGASKNFFFLRLPLAFESRVDADNCVAWRL